MYIRFGELSDFYGRWYKRRTSVFSGTDEKPYSPHFRAARLVASTVGARIGGLGCEALVLDEQRRKHR